MKGRFLCAIALLAVSALSIGQALVVPPKLGSPAKLSGRWKPGTPDAMSPVAPTRRSTKDRILPIQHPVEPGAANRLWSGPQFQPTTNDFAPAYLDDAEMNDAADILFKANSQPFTGVNPADLDIAVGPEFIIQVANSTFSILEKGGNLRFTTGINAFLNDSTSIISNGRVIYDPWQQRWVQLWNSRRGSNQAWVVLLVSDDADPNGNWLIYQFPAVTGEGILAYPYDYDLGYSQNAIVASGNQYAFFGDSFTNAALRTFNKAELYSGSSALMRTTELSAGSHGIPFAPRAVQLQGSVTGLDAAFVATLPGGGNRLLLWKITDIFGAHSVILSPVIVANYVTPPPAKQPGGVLLPTMDCRLTNAVAAPYNGELLLFTGGQDARTWFGESEPRAVNHFYVVDMLSSAVEWEGVLGLPLYYYWISGAAVDMRGSATWVLARCGVGTSAYLETRFVDWNQGSFSNASKQVRFGESIFSGNRWGSYFDASMDWGDYQGVNTKARTWVFGKVAPETSDTWSGWTSTAAFDAVAGTIEVTPTAPQTAIGYLGQSFSPASFDFQLTNPGEVGVPFSILELPDWLEAVPVSYGDVLGGTTRTITVRFSQAALALPIGRYTSPVVFRNLFNGQTITRTINLNVRGNVPASEAVIFAGSEFDGDLAKLQSSDNLYFTLFNDPITLEASLVVLGYIGIRDPSEVTYRVESNVARLGLGLSVRFYNYQTSQFDAIGGSNPNGSDTLLSTTVTNLPQRYVNQVSRQVAVLLSWLPINDEDPTTDGWLHNIDHAYWFIIP